MTTLIIIVAVGLVIIVVAALALRRKQAGRAEPRASLPDHAQGAPAPRSSDPLGAVPRQPVPAPRKAAPDASLGPTPELVLTAPPSAAVAAPTLSPAFLGRTSVQSLRKGLARSREDGGFFGRLKSIFSSKGLLAADVSDELEEILLGSDVGVATTTAILERVRASLGKADLGDGEAVRRALRDEAQRILEVEGKPGTLTLGHRPTVILMVGVNGAGKTTTIGKLATRLQGEGKKCVLAAGDTFRAAAVEQLRIWGERVGCEVVEGEDGADPASVIFTAIKRAEATGADVVLADTAGRLHTKTNLMNEMKKLVRSAAKAQPDAPHEVLLVLDATNGQNAAAQATQFKEALPITGLILTKLDGTAKGGVILGICDTLKLPVRFVGLGERAADLHEFVPAAFVEALLGAEASGGTT